MVRSENEPSAESEASVDEHGAQQESQHGRESFLERHDQHVIRPEESQVAQNSEPDKQVTSAQQDTANIP